MHETVRNTDVDEHPVRGDARDGAIEHVAVVQLRDALSLPRAAQLLRRGLLGEDQAVALWVDLEHAQAQLLADEGADRLGYTHLAPVDGADRAELRERHEATHADVDHDATAIGINDLRVDQRSGSLKLRHLVPARPVSGPSQREHDAPVRTLRLDHRRGNDLTDAQLLEARFAHRDHSGWAFSEVDGRLVAAECGHRTLDRLADPQRTELPLLRREELLHGLGVEGHNYRGGMARATRTIPKTALEEGHRQPDGALAGATGASCDAPSSGRHGCRFGGAGRPHSDLHPPHR